MAHLTIAQEKLLRRLFLHTRKDGSFYWNNNLGTVEPPTKIHRSLEKAGILTIRPPTGHALFPYWEYRTTLSGDKALREIQL